jgi:hypothetical protein
MYLVNYKEYCEFLNSENISFNRAVITTTPCIVEFRRGEILKAKVEVVDKSVYKWNNIYGLKNFKESRNKYWIRGKERVRVDAVQ